MPRTEEANQHIREQRREQILKAAAHVFARKGLADTSIAEIAATAGVSHGLIYRHFASKEEVFAAVVEQSLAQAQLLAQAALARKGTAWERLRWITEQMMPDRSLESRPQYFLVVLYALTNEGVPEHVRQMAVRQGELIREVVRQFIIEAQQSGQVRPFDPEQLTLLFLSCIQGLVVGGAFRQGRQNAVFPTVDSVLSLLQTSSI
jgi:AcrR family transcriptional regulator